jgi:hypothetical protein
VLPVCVLPQGRDVRPEHRNTLDKASERRRRLAFALTSIVPTFTVIIDPDPVGSKTFSRIRIRKHHSGSVTEKLRIRNEF